VRGNGHAISSGGLAAMDFEALDRLRQSHPAWRRLKADSSALVASFLHCTFL